MQKPKPIRPDQLKHPKEKRSRWNGDKWRNEEKNSFISRVSSVEGTKPPTNLKSVSRASLSAPKGVDCRGKSNPIKADVSLDLEPLKAHQVRMLKRKK